MNDEELLKKRFVELAKKSHGGGYYLFTDFLGLGEQALFNEAKRDFLGVKFTAFGGTAGAERVMIRFGDPDELGYEEDFPISCIKIEPKQEKFADKLTHRDFLGALLNLGIDRSRLGDIPIIDNVGYLFLKDDMVDFILSSLTRVKRTDVKLSKIDTLPEGDLYRTERRRIQLQSERIDAVVAKVFGLSREDSLAYFKRGLVFVDGRLTDSASYSPKQNEIISVRGLGRLIYRGFSSTSKKGKLNADVDVFI